jgi:MmeI, target recognition domain/MmeI, C-terminal domain
MTPPRNGASSRTRMIDEEPHETRHKALSPYLFDASLLTDRHTVVHRTRNPGGGMPRIQVGSKPVDGGYFIMDGPDRCAFLRVEPKAMQWLRPYIGSREHINGGDRWILTLHGSTPQQLRAMPAVMKAVEQVRQYRLGKLPPRNDPDGNANEASALSLNLAKTPTAFHVTVLPNGPFLVIPEVSSSARPYLPIGWLEPPAVPSNKLLVALDVRPHQFALLTSRMHMAWTAYVGGRLKSDYQYSSGINYNPFPWPSVTAAAQARLDRLAQAVLAARVVHHGASLADLYDDNVMPADLRKAHEALDLAVDRLYRSAPFGSDRERVEHLFALYEKQRTPLTAKANAKPRRKRVKAVNQPS